MAAKSVSNQNIVILGAGPAGLGCAHELFRGKNTNVQILEKNDDVGGLARTREYKGHYFDLGPHRFYTKNEEVLNLWKETLGKNFAEVPRLTRILYKNKLFFYPVQLKDALLKLGFWESSQSLLSFLYAKVTLRNLTPKTFEEWVTKNFGKKLYSVFFKTYTERVWGIPCHKIGAEWAAQRIKNLSMIEVIKTAVLGQRARKAKSLVDKFYYPTEGAGLMYQRIAQKVKEKGCKINLNSKVIKINHKNGKVISIEYDHGKQIIIQAVDYVFSSIPITDFILSLNPKPNIKVRNAAEKLFFRDHITANLIIDKPDIFPDNWIYVHTPGVEMARIANYNNFYIKARRNNKTTAITVEYFVFKTDAIWKKTDQELIDMAKKELEQVGLLRGANVIDAFIIKETHSYPTYFQGHKKHLDTLINYLSQFKNLQLIGRGGMYKYNNMDHAVYTGMLAARNFIQGKKSYDIWKVNEDAEYLEEQK